MRVFSAVLFLFLPTLAHGATCPAGQYLNNDECKDCLDGHYCPGDEIQHPCPPTTQGGVIGTWNDNTDINIGATEIEMCLNSFQPHTFDHGIGDIRCYYNLDSGKYDKNCHLSQTFTCDAGYYSVGFENFNSQGKPYVNYDCMPVEHGYYSPAEDLNRYQCMDGYTTRTETATDVSECVPLCTAGATKFHVGDFVFNIYANKLTTPAINIDLGDGSVCYVPLVEGSGKGALNVDYHGVIYHTSD